LGTMLHLDDPTKHEIQNRNTSTCRIFWSLKRLLLNRKISLNRRLRLFDATVSSCLLWCCESWTPRVKELLSLKAARNGMLRRIVGGARLPDEEWVEWIRRATRKAMRMAESAGVKDWIHVHFRCKWLWAGHVARREPTSWLNRVASWRDSYWQDLVGPLGSARPLRPSRRRWMKWEDSLRRHCHLEGLGHWSQLALCRENWTKQAEQFAEAMGR